MKGAKKQWIYPQAVGEVFTPNEYIAACGDSGKVYYFKCDAPAGTLYYYPTSDGAVDGIRASSTGAKKLGIYHPCNITHQAASTNPFYDGFVDRNGNKKQDKGEGVIVWRGEYQNNGHATNNLNMDSWETAKS
ncbi:MAG: hypothetical protein PHD70_05635 [Anaerostipes sp.]|jgi:hypothetical protein|nr:hypothetical protein [Anaerostipes sp.]MDD3745938.1 hypothetical protein [Anaerostipes sp.]